MCAFYKIRENLYFLIHRAAPEQANGPAANGPAANGPAANSPAANSPAANGPAANSPAANSPAANGPAANGPAANGPAAAGGWPGAAGRPGRRRGTNIYKSGAGAGSREAFIRNLLAVFNGRVVKSRGLGQERRVGPRSNNHSVFAT